MPKRRSLAQEYILLFGYPPASVEFLPDSLEQPDTRQIVDSITTYGVQDIPDLSGVLNAQLGASNK